MNAIIIDTFRDGYTLGQVAETMTAGELRELLEDYDDDTPVYLGFDDRYTYGGIREKRVKEIKVEDE